MKIELEDTDIERIVERLRTVIKSDCVKTQITQVEALMDTKAVARYLGVDVSWVNKAVSEKRIPYIKIGKYNKFRKHTIDSWIEKNAVKTKEENAVKPIEPLSLSGYKARRKNEQRA